MVKYEMVSKKALDIPPFIVMDVLEKAQDLERSGEHIIHLEVGSRISTLRSVSAKQVTVRSVTGKPITRIAWV